MSRESISSVITGSFITRFQGVASGSTSAADSAKAALGGSSSKASIGDGLRLGARTYGTAVQGLNSLISFANISRSTLENLLEITDKLIDLSKSASKASTGQNARNTLDTKFKKLANDFQKLVETTKVGDKNLVDKDGLDQLFQVMGLDKETSDSIKAIFDQFDTNAKDTKLASEYEKGKRPLRIPSSAYRSRSNTTITSTSVGDGTFSTAASFSVGTDPRNVTAADLNNDGKQDFITANTTDNNITVTLGNGDGTFSAPRSFVSQTSPYGVLTSDYNGDGYTDLGVVGGSGSLYVHLGLGDGSFQTARSYVVDSGGGPSYNLINDDFNNDGRQDVAAPLFSGAPVNGIGVLLGNSDGSFSSAITSELSATAQPMDIASGDLDADGFKDIVTANLIDGTVAIFQGNGDGTFNGPTSYVIGTRPSGVTLADLDGDGTKDIILTDRTDNTVSVLLNNTGGGTFAPVTSYAVGPNPYKVLTGDFNQDGIVDLATADSAQMGGTPGVSILLGVGDGSFQAAVSYPTGSAPLFGLTAADFTGDGVTDLVGVDQGASQAHLLEGGSITTYTGAGTFRAGVSYASGGALAATVKDVNFDGFADVVTAGTNDVFVSLANVDGTFTSTVSYATSSGTGKSFVDVNGDGSLDAISFGANLSVNLGRPDGTFGAATAYVLPATFQGSSYGDINGDNKIDLVSSDFAGAAISVFYGNGDGSFGAPISMASSNGVGAQNVQVMDVNGDGLIDVTSFKNGSSSADVFLGNGNGSFRAPLNIAGGTPYTLADINQDTRPDSISLTAGGFTIAMGNGNGTFLAPTTIAVASGLSGVLAQDFNGDGTPDVVTNGAGDAIYALMANGDGTFGTTISYAIGTASTALVSGDVNGDSALDVISLDSAGNTFSVLLGESALNSRGSPRNLKEYSTLFDSAQNIRSRPMAYKMMYDLQELRGQIEKNIKAIDNAVTVIGDNLSLVRAAGFAFLDMSNTVTSSDSADKIAAQLQLMIRNNAGAALAQAENLESITVAALTLSSDSFTSSSKK